MSVELFNLLVGLFIVFLQIVIVFLVVLFYNETCGTKNTPSSANLSRVASMVAKKTPFILPSIFIASSIGSFIYEYGYGYAPCLLCWYQRLAIFGVAILATTANISTSALVRKQITIFSLFGIAVSLFHNFIDIFPSKGIDVCGVNGVSCLIRYVYEFGYITIPMMSLTVLVFGLLLVGIAHKKSA